jgi:hypothetical protein
MKKGLLSNDSSEVAICEGERAHKNVNGQFPTGSVGYLADGAATFQTVPA